MFENIKGRGCKINPANRFYNIDIDYENDFVFENPQTEIFKDTSRSIISYNQSPDIGVKAFVNPYRGCEHGCIYCYARPYHEYLDYSSGLDFETKIFAKYDAPNLLRKELSKKNYKPEPIGLSGVTDPYQPVERNLKITRACLQVFGHFRHPVGIVTKNALVLRDIDILKDLSGYNAALVLISLTTLDTKLAGIMEPRTSRPEKRLAAISELSNAGIPVGVMLAPVIPALTDHEIPALLKAAADAGAVRASYVLLRLPFAVKKLFENWLNDHFPDRKDKILNRIRSTRGGGLYQNDYFKRMRGEGPFAEYIKQIFASNCNKLGLNEKEIILETKYFQRIGYEQLELF